MRAPIALDLLVALGLAGAIWRARFGRPPEERDIGTAVLWALAALVLGTAATLALVTGRGGAILIGAGVAALCAALWYGRGQGDDPDDEGGGGGGGGTPDDDGPGPIDWDAFDDERSGWDRPRTPA